jgi:adenylate cyclase
VARIVGPVTDSSVVAQWEAAGLYDPEADDADEQRAILEHLAALGMSAADIEQAARRRQLGQVAADRILWGDRGPSLTAAEVAAHAGITRDAVRSVGRAAGLADPGDEPGYRERHVELFDTYALGVAIFGAEATLQFTRVLGAAAARAAEAAVSLFLTNISPHLPTTGTPALEGVRETADAVSSFGGVPVVMEILLRDHFIAAIRRLGLLDIGEGGTTTVAIAFVDLADSTDLAHHVGPTELSSALTGFEHAAQDAAVARECRVVKLIGDEVMLAGASAAQLLEVVDEVLAKVDDHPVLGAGRAGLATGDAVSRDGDYFGPVVNLAARLVGAARAGEVLMGPGIANDAAARGFAFDDVGAYTLKGFEEPVPVARLRRSRP